jgi:hypothetical protein
MEIYEYRIIPIMVDVSARATAEERALECARHLYGLIMQQQEAGFVFYRLESVASKSVTIKMSWERHESQVAVFRSRRA